MVFMLFSFSGGGRPGDEVKYPGANFFVLKPFSGRGCCDATLGNYREKMLR
jgi:hypothetical protein